MIKTEDLYVDSRHLIRTWSDADVKIHGGFPESDYEESIDSADSGRTYVETDIPIDSLDLDPAETLSILLGGDGE